MAERIKVARWGVIGESRRGASHVRLGMRNQDSLEYWVSPSQDTVALAIADGHGGNVFFRSDTGSRIAVAVAVETLQRFASLQAGAGGPSTALSEAKAALPAELTSLWRKTIENHLAENPIRPEELAALKGREGQTGLDRVTNDPIVIYGSTLLGILVTPRFILYLQLGDGDILRVDPAGETAPAVESDSELIANQTHSLCQPNAGQRFRISVQDPMESPPALILAATDGYSNSFVSESDFLMIGRDYLQTIQADGLEKTEKNLARFLDQTSAEGSGDDVTLGVIIRLDMPKAVPIVGAVYDRPPAKAAIPVRTTIEEEISMAEAERLTRELENARQRINQLDSVVASLTTRVRYLQIGLLIVLLLALGSLAIAFVRAPRTNPTRQSAAPVAAEPVPQSVQGPESTPLRMLVGQSAIPLEPGMKFTADQMGLGTGKKEVAEVRQSGNEGLELVNLSGKSWTTKSAGGSAKTLKAGEVVKLESGMEIRMGEIAARIQ